MNFALFLISSLCLAYPTVHHWFSVDSHLAGHAGQKKNPEKYNTVCLFHRSLSKVWNRAKRHFKDGEESEESEGLTWKAHLLIVSKDESNIYRLCSRSGFFLFLYPFEYNRSAKQGLKSHDTATLRELHISGADCSPDGTLTWNVLCASFSWC